MIVASPTAPHTSRCYKQAEFVQRIENALGVKLGKVTCHIVNTQAMTKVMGRAGWSANEANGVVGFQYGTDVYVLDTAPWTVLHELIHRAGVNADRMNRYVAEGLTEAIAVEIKKSPDEHRHTYPTESAWVRDRLLPRLGLTAVELGSVLAKSKDAPGALADLMMKARPDLNRSTLVRELQPQKPNQPSFNVHRGCATRAGSLGHQIRPQRGSDSSGALAGVLLLAGGVLALPAVSQWWSDRERLPGGLAAGRPVRDFDPKQLQRGTEVELEHGKDRATASEIARDHLTEHPSYYVELERMERRLRRRKEEQK
jgi:hypothetical protein